MTRKKQVHLYINKEDLNKFDNLIITENAKSRSSFLNELIEKYIKNNTLKGEQNNEK